MPLPARQIDALFSDLAGIPPLQHGQVRSQGACVQGSFVGSFPEGLPHEDVIPEAGIPDEWILHSVALSLAKNLIS